MRGDGPRANVDDERGEMLAVLARAAERFDDLARHVPDPGMVVRGSTWTAADLIAHVAGGLEAYARYLDGDGTPAVDVSDLAGGSLAASNAARLAEDPERAIAVLLDRAAAGLAIVTARARDHELDELVPWHGRAEPLRCLLATALAEQLIHGRDLATSIGVPWPISRREAVLVIGNIAPLLPILVNPDTTRPLVAAIRIKLRAGPTIPLTFDRGTLSVGGDHRRFDTTVNADPVSFLLVAYGRESQWREIARGGLVAWGRRPWLALKLTSYLVAP